MQNHDKYPLKFSLLTVKEKNKLILEAGCGAGRILRYYHNKGYKIIGIDFIKEAINKLREKDPTLDVRIGDITNLKFESNFFDYVLAFGLYHNLNKKLELAIKETARVLKKGGYVCASFRADNFQNRITDYLRTERNSLKNEFHKMNLTKNEFVNLFSNNSFFIENVFPVENMPFLYKFSFFRAKNQKEFNESVGRRDGYQLSFFGKYLQKILISLFPNQFCNIYVIIARKI
jgi:SAM-dependent methyltransferase